MSIVMLILLLKEQYLITGTTAREHDRDVRIELEKALG